MTDMKQPEALRLSEWLDHHGERTTHSDAADELRRQHAEIESLQVDLAHKDDYAERLGRELAKADSVIKELRAKLDELEEQEPVAIAEGCDLMWIAGKQIATEINAFLYLAAGARPVEEVPGAGDQVQMILKHRLMRKVEGDWLAASEFMTGEPDPSWLAKTEESPEEWRIEQARRVSGEQIQAGLTRAFASWKKPAPAAVVGPVKLPFAIMDDELEALRRFDECVRDSDAGGYDVRNEMMKRLAEIGLVRRVTANIYEHTNFGLSVLNGDFDAATPTTQPAHQQNELELMRAAQADAFPREDFAKLVVQEACETDPADDDNPECIRILCRDLKSSVLAAFLRHDAARAAKEPGHG